MKNQRRRMRRRRQARRRAELRWIESELANPSPGVGLDANFDEAILDHEFRRCTGCGGTGFKERRHKPAGRVVCRVCQGHGFHHLSLADSRITPWQPSKVYWRGRWRPDAYRR